MSHEADERMVGLDQELLNRQALLVVIEFSVCVIITSISFVGNGFVLVALYRNPRLRRPSNLYIISLALSDIILSSVAMPFTCVSALDGQWMFGGAICWLQASLATMLGTTSLANMALIAANRLLKVVYPNMHRKLVSKKTILISILTAWCYTGAVPLSLYLTGVKNTFHPGHLVCLFDFSTASYTLVALIAIFEAFIPYQVIFVCYLKVWHFLKRHSVQVSAWNTNAEDIKRNRLLALIVMTFTVCFTPFLVVILLESFHEQFSLPRQVYLFATIMVGLASCVNPVIYGIMNTDFRREFVTMFRGRRERRIAAQEEKRAQRVHPTHIMLNDVNTGYHK